MTINQDTKLAAPILELKNVTKRFGGLVAVNSVSLTIQAGEVLSLVGDNGAGKSTLIKMISGVYPPDEGQIFYDGKHIQVASPMYARGLGIETIYQELSLAENMNVSDNIFMGREPVKKYFGNLINFVDRKTMDNLSKQTLNRLDIKIPSLHQKISNLSGGQRQAVAIARAVHWKARLVIMDEPTAALGVAEQHKVFEIIKSLRAQGVTIIVISHNMADVFAVSDRIVVMRRGKVVGTRITKNTHSEEIVGLICGAEEVISEI